MRQFRRILPRGGLELTFFPFTIKLYLVPDGQSVGLGVLKDFQFELGFYLLDLGVGDGAEVELKEFMNLADD